MSYVHPAWVEHQRKRWLRPDWQRWVRHDANRFAPSDSRGAPFGASQTKSLAERRIEQRRAEERDALLAIERREQREGLLRLRAALAYLKFELAWRRLCRKYGYNPDQPRDDHGRWTDGGEEATNADKAPTKINDPRVISDETPDGENPGAQFAQRSSRGRGGGPILINGQLVELTPRQEALLQGLQVRANAAFQQVREVLPNWKPTASTYTTVEGLIGSVRAEAEQAEARVAELQNAGALPGRFAGESIPARGPERSFNAWERKEGNRIGNESGCHTCGNREPGTTSGNFVLDHQLPNALNLQGAAQRLFPQCLSCSLRQGGWITGTSRSR